MSPRQTQSNDFNAFVRKSLFVAALISLGVLLWFLWGVLLLIFAAALLARAIRDLALPFARWTPLGTSAAIAVVVLLLLIFLSSHCSSDGR
jgi:predicted PurR-regulated permease PerM